MRWINGRPSMWYGFTDMGPIQIPTLPMYMGLNDRDTGTVYYLTHNIANPGPDGNGYVSISDIKPTTQPTVIYAAYDGPLLGDNPTLRLLVRGGRLGYELVTSFPNEIDRTQMPLTRRVNANETREIYKPTWWQAAHIPADASAKSDELAWTLGVLP